MYHALVIADSVNPLGERLTSIVVEYPRFILPQLNTHRVFSRSSASSRAIPIEKRIKDVEKHPFIPDSIGREQPGMVAQSLLPDQETERARQIWLTAARNAVDSARQLAALGVHKQLAARVLEPFMWQKTLITSAQWSNFIALRIDDDAQPEIQILTQLIQAALNSSQPKSLSWWDWHLPFSYDGCTNPQVCAARCARVSYLRHTGNSDIEKDKALANRLLTSRHMSPFEHVAQVTLNSTKEPSGNFHCFGYTQYRKTIPNENDFSKVKHE